MKPHRRKDTSPRREPGSDPQGDEAIGDEVPGVDPVGNEAEPAHYEADPGTVGYDPGSALVEENVAYGDSPETYVDPSQAYYDPNPAYADPAQAYYDPNPAYGAAEPVDHAEAPPAFPHGGLAEIPPPPPIVAGGGVYDETAVTTPAPVPAGPSRSTAKKKVSGRAPLRRPVAGGRVPASRRPPVKKVYGESSFSFMTVFLGIVALGMVAAVVMVVLPKDMASVAGYPADIALAGGKPRNLLEEAQKVMIERNAEVSFTEEEVNRYLNARVQGEQTGLMASLVKFRGVYIDFSPEIAEIVIERELFGMPLTMTSKMRADKFRSQTVYKPAGWTLGRVELGQRNVKPVVELFIRLRGTFVEEYHTLQQMVDVRFEQDRVVLDSRI